MYRIKINYVYLHEFIRRYIKKSYIIQKTYIKRLIITKILKYMSKFINSIYMSLLEDILRSLIVYRRLI